ncbi:MAG: PPOX class F420-dependent oxidoreductase [Dehalococcoidia bacterium]|nr:PPOX class F420-dependent oxidoreductase [Dehalococcoidia bacterium]
MAPLSEKVRAFLAEQHAAVLTTFRKDGAAQMSIVFCGLYQGTAAFTTTADRAKLINLKHDPRCSLLISKRDWWGYVVLEGRARLLNPGKTDAATLRTALRDVYRAAAGKDHPNWQEYDEAMVREKRSVVMIVPERVYGPAA